MTPQLGLKFEALAASHPCQAAAHVASSFGRKDNNWPGTQSARIQPQSLSTFFFSSIEIAPKLVLIGPLGPKALKCESFEGKGFLQPV